MLRQIFKKLVDRHILHHWQNPEANAFLFGGIGGVGGLFCAPPSDDFSKRAISFGVLSIIGATGGFILGATLGPALIVGTGVGVCATSIEKILTVSS